MDRERADLNRKLYEAWRDRVVDRACADLPRCTECAEVVFADKLTCHRHGRDARRFERDTARIERTRRSRS